MYCTRTKVVWQILPAMSADAANRVRVGLQSPPAVLSEKQVTLVHEAVASCVRRLDELEVEGLLVRFRALSAENKEAFLDRVRQLQ